MYIDIDNSEEYIAFIFRMEDLFLEDGNNRSILNIGVCM
jgi:hypothetical protein